MDGGDSIERALEAALSKTESSRCPPKLGKAMRYAVFPGGARIRPRLSLSVARACGAADEKRMLSAASAVELMHCASLVHDDLPCFDDADVRRGKPSVHRAFGEDLAILTGDALIVMAFEVLAEAFAYDHRGLAAAVLVLSRSTGAPSGIAAGQAWEAEDDIQIDVYHEAKTGALFAAATGLGAIAADCDANAWMQCGSLVGQAFQAIDDIRDVVVDPASMAKPDQQDLRHGRPNLANRLGVEGAVREVTELVERAVGGIPDCPGRMHLQAAWRNQLVGLVPVAVSSEGPVRAA
jgi:geranylgeranyl diphosphate synthase type II